MELLSEKKYNKAKSEDNKQPRCPEDKVKAIEAAIEALPDDLANTLHWTNSCVERGMFNETQNCGL